MCDMFVDIDCRFSSSSKSVWNMLTSAYREDADTDDEEFIDNDEVSLPFLPLFFSCLVSP